MALAPAAAINPSRNATSDQTAPPTDFRYLHDLFSSLHLFDFCL